jgi:hypothetical protein
MHQQSKAVRSKGKVGRSGNSHWIAVGWDEGVTVQDVVSRIASLETWGVALEGPEFFAEHGRGVDLCLDLREHGVNVLWSAVLEEAPSRELLREMRLSGCQRLSIRLDPGAARQAYAMGREFGFDMEIAHADGSPCGVGRRSYSVAEREEIAGELPGLHAAQFDLAVACFRAGRYDEVMRPLGKAMTLGFPANELCLNLLACLSAARHYPDVAAGLLDQARYGWPHPVVMRNRKLLRSWLESGGDVKGVRLELDPGDRPASPF